MEHEIVFEDSFFDGLARFTEGERKLIFRKVEFLKRDDFNRPRSLRAKKMEGNDDFYECSVNMGIRLIYTRAKNRIHIVNVGRHDIFRKYG